MVLAPALHAFTQAPQPMQFFGYTINCGLTDRVSGLWHQLHAMLHPLKNTVVRIPGMGRGDEAVQKIADYILTLFEQGATLLNINIVNGQQILEADKDPSKYPDLVVRVTGFTAYFCSLTPEFRKLVVDRILIQGGA